MLMKNFDKKKKIGIPIATGLWCISKAFIEYTVISAISLLLSVFIFCYVVSDEYFEARTSIKIFVGIGILSFIFLMIASLLPYELGLDDFGIFLAMLFITIVSFVIAFCIRLKDDVVISMNLKKMNRDRDEE